MALMINGKRVAMSIISKIVPSGRRIVTENGVYDVESFAEVEVDVSSQVSTDEVVHVTTVTVPAAQNSGNFTWLTQQDLVNAGFLDSVTENLYNKYTDILIDVQMQSNTHSNYQIVQQRSSKLGFNYSGNNKYYKTAYRHGNSTSSASAIQTNVVMTTSTTGYCNYSTANGLFAALSSSYLLVANSTYRITLVAVK